MSPDDGSVPLVRVSLRRLQVSELVAGDEALRACPLLTALPEHARAELFDAGCLKRYPDGAMVFDEGQGGEGLIWIARGEIRLVARNGAEVVELAVAQKGDVVGEGIALGAAIFAWSAVARGEVDVVEFGRAPVLKLMAEHPPAREYLASVHRGREAAFSEMASFLGRW